jgi:hypothetical protein
MRAAPRLLTSASDVIRTDEPGRGQFGTASTLARELRRAERSRRGRLESGEIPPVGSPGSARSSHRYWLGVRRVAVQQLYELCALHGLRQELGGEG